MVQLTYPGVYIEEFTPGAPIVGVSTNIAAFAGPASNGEINVPTKITSWDRFRGIYGDQPLPGFFLWYAVRGFFENGGQICYIVRVSNGKYGALQLKDRTTAPGNPIINVRARQPGGSNPAIQVTVAGKHLLSTELYRPTATIATITGREFTFAPDAPANAAEVAARFRPGDFISIDTGQEPYQVVSVSAGKLRIGSDLIGNYNPGDSVRLAKATQGTRVIRIKEPVPAGTLVPGTVLTISQTLSDSQVVESVQIEHLPEGITTYRVTLRQGIDITLDLALTAAQPAVVSEDFDITVTQGAGTTYPNLSFDPAHPRFFMRIINDHVGGLVRMSWVEPPPPVALPQSLPKNDTDILAGGQNEDFGAASFNDDRYTEALDTLRMIDDVNLIAIPDRPTSGVQQAILDQCQQLADRFAILDAESNLELFGADSIEIQRAGLDTERGYGALYYPWLRVRPIGAGNPILVPPSGHVCGIIARSDNLRGVHKAPANEIVSGALGVERTMSDIEQGQLNLEGINVIRLFQEGGRPVLWGARTTATNSNWQYVNIRRLFLYLEESIEEGIRWAVFEPNNLALWQKLKRTITEFLLRVWRDGALFGEKAEDAFYVRIDEVLNPFSEQALGRLHIEIGVRPTYPAEFIIIHIGIWPGGSEISEA